MPMSPKTTTYQRYSTSLVESLSSRPRVSHSSMVHQLGLAGTDTPLLETVGAEERRTVRCTISSQPRRILVFDQCREPMPYWIHSATLKCSWTNCCFEGRSLPYCAIKLLPLQQQRWFCCFLPFFSNKLAALKLRRKLRTLAQ